MSSGDDLEYELMCQTCTIRPAYSGYRHCSKACAEKAPKSRPKKPMDEDEDERGEDLSARMGRLSVSTAPSAKARLCIGCKEIPAAGGHMFCSKACKADHSRAGASKAAVSSNQYSEGEDNYDSFEEEDTRDRRKRDPPPARRRTSDREPSGSTALARRPPMCMFCRRNPKVGNSAFCGRRCMQDAMAELNPRQGPSSGGRKRRDTQDYSYQDPSQMFADSLQSPDWYQNGYGGPYGQAYQGYNQPQQAYPPPQPSYNVPQMGYPAPQQYYPQMQWPAYPPQPAGAPCAISGCKAVAFSGSKYCGQACRKDAVTKGLEHACLFCKVYPKSFRQHFCSQKCGQTAENQGPMLLDVPATDPKFADIVKQFNDTWGGGYGRKPAANNGVAAAGAPTIKRVCKVVNTKAVETRYQAYRKQVEARGKFADQGKPEGNEMRRWHGTQRICTVGDTAANLTLCTNAGCRLCSIIRVSFQTSSSVCTASGIYTSAFSGVSNGYTRVQSVGSPYKAMFLTRIVVGKRHVGGYAPVAGTDSTAIDNMDSELIVFTNDAILPSWLVMYS